MEQLVLFPICLNGPVNQNANNVCDFQYNFDFYHGTKVIKGPFFKWMNVLEIGALSLLRGQISIGQIQAFFQFAAQMCPPLTETPTLEETWTIIDSTKYTDDLLKGINHTITPIPQHRALTQHCVFTNFREY